MYKKFVYLVCFVLVMSLASNAFAWDFAAEVTSWTGAVSRDWTDGNNWTLRVPDPSPGLPGNSNTLINATLYTGGMYDPLISSGQVASTSQYDTWGPEFGAILDIEGGTYSGPAFVGLNEFNNDLLITTTAVNLGGGGSGGSIIITNLMVGDNWWAAGPYVTFNQYSGVAIANDWIWLGGRMNLLGGYTRAEGGMNIDALDSSPAKIADFGGLYGSFICTLNIADDGMLSLPVGLYDDGTIAGWIANGYLVSGNPGGEILFDFEMELERVVLTGTGTGALPPIPEPATIVLLGLGGLALIRRKRS